VPELSTRGPRAARSAVAVKAGVVLAGVAAAVLASGAAIAAADAAGPLPEGADYVALGSSYGAGPGLKPVVDVGCMRSGADYAHRIADQYRLHLIDVACSGATVSNILSRPQRAFHRSVEPQIDAVTPGTRLVTVVVGGNDLDYIGGITTQSCHNSLPRVVSGRVKVCSGKVAKATSDFTAVEHSLIRVVTAVRGKAPDAIVVIVDYLPILDPAATACTRVPLTHEQAVAFRKTYDGLLAATERAATATGARLARVPDATPEDHTPCGSQPWITGYEVPNPAEGKGIPYHPTDAGMAVMADAVADTLGKGA